MNDLSREKFDNWLKTTNSRIPYGMTKIAWESWQESRKQTLSDIVAYVASYAGDDAAEELRGIV